MTQNDFIQLKRVREYHFCRVSQADEPRISAPRARGDSDGKDNILNEQPYAA